MIRAVMLAAAVVAVPAAAQTAGSSASTPGTGASTPAAAASEPPAVGPDLIAGRLAVHVQATFVTQGTPAFRAAYDGPNSLKSGGDVREAGDITLFTGISPWRGFEIWADTEVDQGFGLSNTVGAAGFPSAEGTKVGSKTPYLRIQRVFLRQTINLGGGDDDVPSDLNQLGLRRTADRLTLTLGKFSVGDIFDTNRYAHDPKSDFLNWASVTLGSFDYAADAWGYSYGAAAELTLGRWTARAGLFDLSTIPNGEVLETDFRQYQLVGEVERRIMLRGRPGAVRLLGWLSRGNIARLDDAVAYGRAHGTIPDLTAVRRFRDRYGIGINVEQEINDDVGAFLRAGVTDGSTEAVEYTEIDRTVQGGVQIKGKLWGRDRDEVGIDLIANGLSAARRRFLAAGGIGILIGDGRLPHAGPELIGESYYQVGVIGSLHVAADAQLIVNPAYNRDRGPVPVLALKAHAQF